MRTQLPLIFCMGLSLQAYAQDVNNPTASPLDRPQGPPSAPAISVPQAPIASSAPTTTDPNAPVDGRADEAIGTGAHVIAAACPFCNTMLTDGVKGAEKESDVQVLDVAELIAASME